MSAPVRPALPVRLVVPAPRAVLMAAAAAVPALAIALAAPRLWWAGLVLVLAVVAATVFDGLRALVVRRPPPALAAPAAAFVGEAVALVAGRLGGAGEWRVEHDARLAPAPEGARALVHRHPAVRRGRAAVTRLWRRWPGAWRLAWVQEQVPLDTAVAVVPDVRPARAAALRLFSRHADIGESQQLDLGAGGEFQALTDWREGIDRRAIHWKASARHGELIAKEYRTERNNDVVLAVDAGRLMSEPVDGLPRVDRALAAALAVGFVALRLGDRVRLFGFDARPRVSSGPLAGVRAFPDLQRVAATLDYSTDETNFTLALTTLASELRRRSLVIVFTDFVDATSAETMLRVSGRLVERHLVLFVLMKDAELEAMAEAAPATDADVARAVVAGDLLRERRRVVLRLQRQGVQIVEAAHDRVGVELVNAYLGAKRSARL